METIRLLLDISIILLALYWLFIKSYTAEKGKNLATKEDIKEITDKIEAVKLEYFKKLESSKLEIELHNELYGELSKLKNCIIGIDKLSNNGLNVEPKWNEFIEVKDRLEIILINHAQTYFSCYKDIGIKFEQLINELILCIQKKESTKYLSIANQLLLVLDEFKQEVYNHLKG